jgi:hypothetical protein
VTPFKSFLGILLWLGGPFFAFQVTAKAVTSVSFQTLCSYDPNCKKLVNWDGTMKAPKQDMLFLIKKFRSEILQAGKDYEVDPRAIAGSLLAENSLNVHVDDKLQEDLVRSGIASEGKFLAISFSFGWGQIYTGTAEVVEPMMAHKENRPLRNRGEIAQALLQPDQSVKYVAALLLKSQNVYKQHGFMIQNNPGVLVSLYNLGKEQQRAFETKQAGRNPRVNYFGFFVELYMDMIQGLLQEDHLQVPVINKEKNPSSLVVQVKTSPSKQSSEKKDFQSSPQQRKVSLHLDPVLIFRAPDQCSTMGSGYDEIRTRNQTYQSFDSVGQIFPQDIVEKLSHTFGCELKSWWLIRTSMGYLGWVPESKISARQVSEKHEITQTSLAAQVEFENLSSCQDFRLKAQRYQDYSKSLLLRNSEEESSAFFSSDSTPSISNSSINSMYQHWYLLIQHSLTKGLRILNQRRAQQTLEPLSKWEDPANPFYLLVQKQHDRNMSLLQRCLDPLWDCSLPDSKYDFAKDLQVYHQMQSMSFNEETFFNWKTKLQILQPLQMVYRGYDLGSTEFHQQTELALNRIQSCRHEGEPLSSARQESSVMDLFFDDLYQGIQKNGLRGLRWKDTINSPMDSLAFLSEVCEKFVKAESESKTALFSAQAQKIQQLNSSDPIYQWTYSVWRSLGQTLQQRKLYLLPFLKSWMLNADHLGIDIASMYSRYANEVEKLSQVQPCIYDPLILAQNIERIISSKCIQAIFVSDVWILNYFRSKSSKVIYDPSQKQGAVSVLRLKNCRK